MAGSYCREFTFENVRRWLKLALYACEIGEQDKPIIVGHDPGSYLAVSRAFAEVLAYHGIKVWFIEEAVPTPMLMFAVDQRTSLWEL